MASLRIALLGGHQGVEPATPRITQQLIDYTMIPDRTLSNSVAMRFAKGSSGFRMLERL